MSEKSINTTQSGYGKLGRDVGVVGRWSRLVWGLFILLPLIIDIAADFNPAAESLAFYGRILLYFLAILAAYTAVYWFLGERLLARANPWLNTVLFVGPALIIAWWEILAAPFAGFSLPVGLSLAMAFYIGLSLIIQWSIRYGGCEVVSIPIVLFKERYTSYCIPLVAVDAVEKAVVDRRENP